MRKWLTGLEVIEKLGINDFELFDFVKEGLPPYTHAREKLPPPNVSDILQSIEEAEKEKDTLEFYNSGLKPKSDIAIKNILEAVKKNPALALNYLAPSPYIRGLHENAKKRMQELNAKLKEIDDRYCWQDYELPNDRMKIRRIYDSLLNSLYKVEDIEATSHAPRIESITQEARSRGGSAPKKNIAIMKAVERFISENPKWIGESASSIAKSFQRKHKSEQPFEVTVDSMKYEIYCDGQKVCSSCEMGRKGKYHERSIAYSTFTAKYIPEAKKQIDSSNTQIT